MTMPRSTNSHILTGCALLILSALLYTLHYWIFRDAHHISVFFLEDIAFIPVHVIIMTLIIEKLLNEREKRATFSKLNMVVSVFFNEVGTPLLKLLMQFDKHPELVKKNLLVSSQWSDKQFLQTRNAIIHSHFDIDSQSGDLKALHNLFIDQKDFLLRLLENPSITEYQSFTDLLLAVFHLSDELLLRKEFDHLPLADYEHLSVDIHRAYSRLIFEWLRYMHHLKRDYPYLFSLAVRTNPFDSNASVIITKKLGHSA